MHLRDLTDRLSRGEKMEDKTAYHCDECGKYEMDKTPEGEIPECCGQKMKEVPLSECTKDPAWAEHARSFEDDEPCDPGISGDI